MFYHNALKSKNKTEAGFTIIEIVIVLLLIGILSAVAVSKYFDLKDSAERKAAQGVVAEAQARINGRFGQLLLQGESCQSALAQVNTKDFLADIPGKYQVTWDGNTVISSENGGTEVDVINKQTNVTLKKIGSLIAPRCDAFISGGGGSGSGGENPPPPPTPNPEPSPDPQPDPNPTPNPEPEPGPGPEPSPGPGGSGQADNWWDRLPYPPIQQSDITRPSDIRGILYQKDGKVYITKLDMVGNINIGDSIEVTGFTDSTYKNGKWKPNSPKKGEIYQTGEKFYVCQLNTCSLAPYSDGLDGWVTVKIPSSIKAR